MIKYRLASNSFISDGKMPSFYKLVKDLGFTQNIFGIGMYINELDGSQSYNYSSYMQIGGGTTIFENNKINISKVPEYTNYSYISEDHIYCFIILVPTDNPYNECRLHGISNDSTCLKDNIYNGVRDAIHSGVGREMLKMAFRFIKRVLQPKHNLKIITLTDNSTKSCPNGNSIALADMYFLLNGTTWYGKYGFKPYDGFGSMDNLDMTIWNRNQKIHETIKVNDVKERLKFYLHKYNDGYFADNMIDELIFRNRNMQLSEFLRKLLKEYDKTCGIFVNFYKYLMEDIGMRSFHRKTFFVRL